jgi:geranylgeranyl diphosphate synthase type I
MGNNIEKNDYFIDTLLNYKKLIDSDIQNYCENTIAETNNSFGEYPTEAVKAYCELLNRGGKRIRGALTMTAYKMFGGTDMQVAVLAARAIEMLHAYILIVDDIQDRSETRRGGPTAHVKLSKYHADENLGGDSGHFGVSVALNGALFGVHSAVNILANLDTKPETRLQIINNVNKNFIATAHGQTLDIFNEVLGKVNESNVDKVLLWKTAYYTFMNPLQLGAVLAGANGADLEVLAKYSLAAGRAFQITDDILGIFGDVEDSGKDPMDDIREGKRTILTVKALESAPKIDVEFLARMLGNEQIAKAEFLRCRDIIKTCGALEYAENRAKESVQDALLSLQATGSNWDNIQVEFLSNLVQFLIDRKS